MSEIADTPSRTIVLIEDDPTDVEAVRRALKKAGRTGPLVHFTAGADALSYLKAQAAGSASADEGPGLVLLDLNLPGFDGREILAAIKGDAALRQLPVVILTSSRDTRDVTHCYAAGANGYLQKSIDGKTFLASIENLERFWFQSAILPPFGGAAP